MNDSRDSIHFKLRLQLFYARLASNHWRNHVLFVGDLNYFPTVVDKKFIGYLSLKQSSQRTDLNGCELVVSSFDELPLQTDSVDLIICDFNRKIDTSDLSILSEFFRILVPQGKLIFTMNNHCSPYYWSFFKRKSNSMSEMKKWLDEYDFEVVSQHSYSCISRWISRGLRRTQLQFEKKILKLFPGIANKISFICVKKNPHYRPCISQINASQKLSLSKILKGDANQIADTSTKTAESSSCGPSTPVSE